MVNTASAQDSKPNSRAGRPRDGRPRATDEWSDRPRAGLRPAICSAAKPIAPRVSRAVGLQGGC